MLRRLSLIAIVQLSAAVAQAQAPDAQLVADAKIALDKATQYYREQVASHGGYVYHYSADLSVRWGEGLATKDEIWVQPPGTPTVGLAYLAAYEATKDQQHLDAARAAGRALMHGQLKSGGWTNLVEFDPTSKRIGNYLRGGGHKKGNNNSTLDDGITQSALQFLMRLDETEKFADSELHQAVVTGLDALLAAQFASGGFPQVWVEPVLSTELPTKASYPKYDWRTEGRIKNYWDMINLNDDIAGNTAKTLSEAHRIYQDEKYLTALKNLGEFLIAAQMPNPQPAWCQQYNYDLVPIWARKFEPPAVTGGESQDVMETLIKIFLATGDAKYLEPIPAALEYLKKSRLPDGRLARYYELETNRPLYMNRTGEQYFLTYDDKNLPDHYGWKRDSRLDAIEAAYQRLAGRPVIGVQGAISVTASPEETRRIVAALDDQGRWLSTYAAGDRLVGQPKFRDGEQYLSSQVFSDNVTRLAALLRQQSLVSGAVK
ncbi:MAG: pectic acid lyase [Planctomycetes bacterium]|nr:pectic acid lyase [Planctomycetota bacterium]